MPTAVVLGAGMVGSVMATDLASDFQVTVADARPEALDAASKRAEKAGRRVQTARADLSDGAAVRRTIEKADIVIGALSSRIGFNTLRTIIESGKHYCDISFFAEDALALDALAKGKGVTAVVDMGVAPGMSNLLAAHSAARFDEPESIAIYVGGLPRERRWPFQYKAAFAPSDVIEEYTRPTRLVEHGEVVVREALTEPEFLDFAGLGTLEAVNTDGLRSLATTLKVPFMKEKTLRYPGHYDLMRAFRATGLFDESPVDVKGVKVSPRDLVAALMFPKWTYGPGEEDLTVMRIEAAGRTKGTRGRVTWDLLDFFDRASSATSMSRTTGLPCTAVARLIAAGRISEPGVLPPERLAAMPGVLDTILKELAGRGIRYDFREEAVAN